MRGRGKMLSVRLIVALAALLCVGVLLPASALAVPHHFLETFGSANEPTFNTPEGLAVDQSTGDLLVIDAGEGTISRWNPDGTPAEFFALGSNEIDGSETPQGSLSFAAAGEVQIAVDNSSGANEGDIYVPQAGAKVVDVFAEDGSFVEQLTESSEGEFNEPCGVGVDPSGNVYVGDFSGEIHKFGSPPVDGESTDFPFAGNCTLAAGAAASEGFIFPAHHNGSVLRLDSTSGAEEFQVDPGEATTVTVDPATGNVLVAVHESREIREYDASGIEAEGLSSISPPSEVKGIAVDRATGNLYVARGGSQKIEVYVPNAVTKPKFELKITKSGAGSGTVISSPAGINCGSECGAEFEDGKVVELEATPAVGSEFTGWTEISGDPGTCTGTTSPCEVTMNEAVELEASFALAAPVVTGLNPTKGPTAGGNQVEISGTSLNEATKVEFGATVVNAPFTEDTGTKIKLDAPAHSAETVDVIVTTAGGASANTAADDYTYVVAPTVTAISPSEGSTAGGNPVEITGTEFAEATKVEFGNVAVNSSSFTEHTATTIKLKAPAHAAGTFDVTVTTPGGPSAKTPADEYTYVATPAVTAVNPTKGPIGGGNQVEITGLRLAEATKVEFGTTVVNAPFTENTETKIKVNAPAHAAGTVDIRVTTLGGTSGKFPADNYTYEVVSPVLTVGKAGTGSGTVTSSPAGINCGSECSHAYGEGTVVTLTATAAGGSTFAGWSGGSCSGTGSCVVTMSAAKAVTATFNANPPPPPEPEKEGTPKVSSKARFSGGKVALQITCSSGGPCSGTVTLKAKIGGKNKVIGKASYSIAAGGSKTIKVKITNDQAKTMLQEGKTIKATLSGPGLQGTVKLSK